ERSLTTVLRLFASVAFGLILSAFYWVRVVAELPYLSHMASDFTSRAYDFRNNFVWSFFYSSAEDYSSRSLVFVDVMLLVTLAMTVPCLAAFYRLSKKDQRANVAGVLIILATGLFFATPLSAPLWEYIGPLERIQFPWRWMAIISLASSV